MSVDVRVVLLVEDDAMGKHLHPYIELETLRAYICMYTMVTDSVNEEIDSHITENFDEPFGAQFHFFFF
jgi:hypothetical protein